MNTHIASDVLGHRIDFQQSGDDETLLPSQKQAMNSYPVLAAVNNLCWSILANEQTLSPDGCTMVSRVLHVGSDALDQIRTTIQQNDVNVTFLFCRVSLVAKNLCRDLRRLALSATGTTVASLPANALGILLQLEALDIPLTIDPSQSPVYGATPYLATVVINNLKFSVASSG